MEDSIAARLNLAVSMEFYRRGWMYQTSIDPESPQSVALLVARREGIEEAAQALEQHWKGSGYVEDSVFIIRELIDEEKS